MSAALSAPVLDSPKMDDEKKLDRVRLTLVIQATKPKPKNQFAKDGLDIQTAKAQKKAEKEAALKRSKETVIHYTNPHEHFVHRKFRQLKANVSPDWVQNFLIRKLKYDLTLDVESLRTGVSQLLSNISLLSSSKMTKDDVMKLVEDLLSVKAVTFSSPETHAFLDDPNVEFYIFREGHTTVYAITDSTHLASMVQLSPFCHNPCCGRPLAKVVSQPVTISELEHLRSCYVRFQRGKKHLQSGKNIEQTKLKLLPPNFDYSHKTVRRLVAARSLQTSRVPRSQKTEAVRKYVEDGNTRIGKWPM